jgi:ubiquitin-like 1-activating enzyme E1 A
LRVWGVDAQKRMRAAHVLVVGTRALSAEVCKNLALAGIGALTLHDDALVTESDLGAQFFLETADIGKNVCCAAIPPTFRCPLSQ